MKNQNNAAYTSVAKDWWQKHSDELGDKMNWDTFCTVWMASINNEQNDKCVNGMTCQHLAFGCATGCLGYSPANRMSK